MITVKKDAIKYKDSDGTMKDSGVLCQVGTVQSGGLDWNKYVSNIGFYNATFPEGYELVLNVPDLQVNKSTNIFQQAIPFYDSKGLEKVKLIGNPNNYMLSVSQMFARSTVRIVDFTEFKIIASGATTSLFNGCGNLEEILGEIDFSNATSFTSTFRLANNLREIRVANGCIKINIYFNENSLLSDSSIQSIIDGLADLTGGTAQTITFHKDVKAKLTENQIAQITSKNWTLA